ncbi:hypothetical protein [Chryseobacterium sp. MFBS3-17]|uniref:hypothetical protein n=1 Tax=Chryseobacterium sp. MFBS3-17 TaxID=2886689 RepID=UPI001D0F231A|nr:hypothetical protein [Chryseobacterium sp. MFBS3-17]MCC2589443.1 hypothetical protein [Chryseobacterium sp. MFBS3-17]
MKKLSYLFSMLMVALALVACRENHTEPGYSDAPLLHFQKAGADVAATDVGYTDHIVDFGTIAPVNGTASVNLVKIEGDAVEGVDYEILNGGVAQVAAGAMNGEFVVRVYGAGLSPDIAKTLVFGLQSSAVGNAVYNQQYSISMKMKCPLPANFPLDYNVSVYAFNEFAPAHVQTLTPVAGTDNQFTVVSSWGPDFVAWATGDAGYAGQYLYPGTITINCGDVLFTTSAGYGSNTVGTYDAATGVIQFDLEQSLFTTAFTTTVTMTPQ